MSDSNDTENIVQPPLLKQKAPRPPQSQKQREAFQKAAAKRAENIKLKKEEKLLNAQKALLEKEGYVKASSIPPVATIHKSPAIQFEIESEEEEEQPPKPLSKAKPRAQPKQKPIKKKPIPSSEPDSEEDYSSNSSSSSEEVIVIKRSKKSKLKLKSTLGKSGAKGVCGVSPQYLEEEEEEVDAPILTDWGKYFN